MLLSPTLSYFHLCTFRFRIADRDCMNIDMFPMELVVKNGDTYAGEYFGDKMHGFGVYRFANGHQYEGAWHEGRRQGLGMYTFRNGETQSGHWQNGVLDIFSTQNTLPGSSIAVNHSKVLNTVQEARRAAGKAFDVPWVDDRVNKAVAVANKAAEAARAAAVKAVQNQASNNGVGIPNLLARDTLLSIA
ncbi:putative phosphatidylinositol 4-phosphate 5-kinase 5 [Cocos nucifera]|uniref:Putative phosphatidylinositol 4-phosphate 5-kinase 5 n=1 Tax=Cocos nucifera TaxID=13894 RepID=A0A8K0N6C2_COCNU|nr:putative phosphatidylinositol 4-phosphate 5-kinase 5 [Cocos nucifera]